MKFYTTLWTPLKIILENISRKPLSVFLFHLVHLRIKLTGMFAGLKSVEVAERSFLRSSQFFCSSVDSDPNGQAQLTNPSQKNSRLKKKL